MSIKLGKHSRTIGYMYSIFEEMKKNHPIAEYSCRESSLEKVYEQFCIAERFIKLN